MTESITFSQGTTVTSDWLNAVDAHVFDYVFNVKDYGAVGNDTTDDAAAIQAAITAAKTAGRGCVYFPAGLYRIESALTVSGDFITFKGDGPRASVIRVYSDIGDVLTVQASSSPGTNFNNSFCMDSLGWRARVETTSGCAIKLNKCQQVYFSNVAIEDFFGGMYTLGGLQHYFSNLSVTSARTSLWPAAKTGSYFIKFDASSDGYVPSEMFYSNVNLRRQDPVRYVENGVVINCADGIWFSNGHVMGVSNADVLVSPSTSTSQITGLKFSNFWFDNNSAYGLFVEGATSVAYGRIELDGCQWLTNTDTAIFVQSTATNFEGLRLNGGRILKSGNYGILLRAGTEHIINGVEFSANNTNNSANQGAIVVNSGANNVLVTGCRFYKTTLGVTSTGMIGVRINSAAVGYVQVNACQFDLDALDISDASTVDTNNYLGNTTTKAKTATAISLASLVIPEIGEDFLVSDGLNFSNITGRWHGRKITLQFAGASTITHGAGAIRLSGSTNLTTKANDVVTFVYSSNTAEWIEISRTIS